MNFGKDLSRSSIPYSCDQCIMKHSCNQFGYRCVKFYPENMDIFLDNAIAYLETNTSLSKDKRMKRRVGRNKDVGLSSDAVTPLDDYYVGLINDSVSQVRKGKTAYVFSIDQIRDVLRFEKGIHVRYSDGYYSIKKSN